METTLANPLGSADAAPAPATAWRALAVTGFATAVSVLMLGLLGGDGVGGGLLLLLGGTTLSVWITSRLARREGAASAWWFAAGFSLKQLLTLIILFGGWIPHLDQNDPRYGYDPQRFHFEAWELARSGFDPATIQLLSLNYGGVLYYYGAAFLAFGWSAMVPALLNCITTLVAMSVVIWGMQQLRGGRLGLGAGFAAVLLVPDLLWFDVVASRESLLSALVSIVMVLVIVQIRGLAQRRVLLWAALAALAIATLRPPVLLPIAFTGVVAGLLLRRRGAGGMNRVAAVALLAGGAAAAIAAATVLTSLLGGYNLNLLSDLSAIATANSEASQGFEWANTSIARRLIPTASWQVPLFTLLRLVLYFVAPWPVPSVTMAGFADGRWPDWQSTLLALSSPLYWLSAPLLIAAALRAVRDRTDRSELTVHVGTIALLLTVAGGNVIVQERYRVMAIGMMVASMLLVRREDLPRALAVGRVLLGFAVGGAV
ncbi:MAG TPA: hypothetical protein VE861_13275, partial [Gemmatimonadaceae bacterium]|nr:hypothetical protein [Gemmatimonadaceae bacterium]